MPDPTKPLAAPEDYVATFEGFRPGQNVLADLMARHYDRDIYVRGGVDAERETLMRLGERRLMTRILRIIAQIGGDPNAD